MTLRPNFKIWPHRGLELQTPPAGEPLTLEQVKRHLRISGSNEDALLTDLISQSRKYVEDLTGLAFLDQTWLVTFDSWPGYAEPWWDGVKEVPRSYLSTAKPVTDIKFPRYPLSSITSLTVYDEDSNPTVVTVAEVFDVDTVSRPGRMRLKRGATWPTQATRSLNAIEIVFVSGYGVDPATIPPSMIQALLQMVAYLYTHRGDGCSDDEGYFKSGAKRLIDTYKNWRI